MLVFAVAAVVTGIELITTKYPQTSDFVVKSVWFYAYILIYGALGAIAFGLLPLVGDQVTTTGIGLGNPWVQAVLVGFSIKAFLHIRVYTVSTGPGQSFPVGLETFVQLFEPWMLRKLELDHFVHQRAFIAPRAARFQDVAAARTQALANIPNTFTAAEQAALTADINQAATPDQVISAYLKYTGLGVTGTTFPSS